MAITAELADGISDWLLPILTTPAVRASSSFNSDPPGGRGWWVTKKRNLLVHPTLARGGIKTFMVVWTLFL